MHTYIHTYINTYTYIYIIYTHTQVYLQISSHTSDILIEQHIFRRSKYYSFMYEQCNTT